MSSHHDANHDPDFNDALAALPKIMEPPPELATRVTASLRAQGHLSTSPSRVFLGFRGLAMAAILLIGFGLGFGLRELKSVEFQYILVLKQGASVAINDLPEEALLVKEYSDWAQSLNRNHLVISGIKLRKDGQNLQMKSDRTIATAIPDEESHRLEGYFLIRAKTFAEAQAIAATCPHLRYGGIAEIYPIER